MDENALYEYLIQMGAMQPEMDQTKRKQAMVDALRKQSMQGPEGQMVSGRYVAPSITQYAAQLGNAYMAAKGQQGVDQQYGDMNARQRQMLEELRKRRQSGAMGGAIGAAYGAPDYGDGPAY